MRDKDFDHTIVNSIILTFNFSYISFGFDQRSNQIHFRVYLVEKLDLSRLFKLKIDCVAHQIKPSKSLEACQMQ